MHEVSQPLATIATYVHACRRSLKADAGGSSALAETLAKAEAEALRAGEIIERLRDFLSQNNVRLYPADLANSAHKIVAALADEARSRNVHVAIDAQPLAVIMVDQVQIEQVLLNLVRNAIDAAADHHNGEKWVRIRARQTGEELEFAVEDNGPGIAPDIAEQLFEPFETTKPRGLGLGLSLSYRIIEAHQGRLWCDKTAREGARFVFRIPYHRTATHD